MSTLNSLLICGLQVTLVATVGLVISLVARRWLRTSATVPLAATLGAVVLLTVCAFSSWPSWLHRPTPQAASQRAPQSVPPAFATDPYLNPYLEHLTPTPWGYVSLPPWMDSILYGTGSLEINVQPEFSDQAATQRWTGAHWLSLFIGVAILYGLVRVIGGLWAVRHFVRTSRPLKSPELLEQIDLLRAEMGCLPLVDIRECPHLATAATVGWRRPVILLSESWQTWTETQLRSVLAHEIAHITRGDFLATVAAQVGVVLHFYHPLVHWLANRLRLEQELAADALAAQVVGGSRAYLNAIGELALKQTEEPVGWPAHSFLPTRRTFLRRIEMLRDLKFLSGSAPRLVRWGTLASVAAVTLVAIGLRPPGGNVSTGTAQAQEKLPVRPAVDRTAAASGTSTATAPLEAQYVPADAFIVIAARPAGLNEQFQKLVDAKTLPADTPSPLGVYGRAVHVSAVVMPPNSTPGAASTYRDIALCLTFADKAARDQAMAELNPGVDWQPAQLPVPGTKPGSEPQLVQFEVALGHGARYQPDDRTLILGDDQIVQKMILAGPKSLSPLTQSESWKQATKGTLAIAIDAPQMQKLAAQAPPNPLVGMFSPLWDTAISHTLGVSVGDQSQLTLTSNAKDAAGAQKIEAIHKAGMSMLSNMLSNAKNGPDPVANKAAESLLPLLEGHKIATQGNQTTLTCEGDLSSVLTALAVPILRARTAARQSQQQNNMQHVMLALHNYNDTFGHFPPAVIYEPGSNTPRSWRVEILPYLEQAPLYEKYNKNEPWDSEGNKKILAQMPALYRHASQPNDSSTTAITAAYGLGLIFQEKATAGTKIKEVLDGTSNTIAIVEAKTEIPWTKPEEVVIDLTKDKLPDFGFDPERFAAGFADGSVRMIPKTTDVATLKKLFTKAGGEVVEGF